jgi:hypothetical protein
MRRALGALVCAATLFAALTTPAPAAPSNGQLAAVAGQQLVALNPDGSGLRTLWTPAAQGDQLSGPAWSPDGNRLAFVHAGRIMVLELGSGHAFAVTNPPAGAYDANPGWSADGARVGFRRVGTPLQEIMAVALDGSLSRPATIDFGTSELAWAPGLARRALVVGPLLVFEGLALRVDVTGAPAWSPDSSQLAFAGASGLRLVPAAGGSDALLAPAPAGPPRWSPDGAALVFPADGGLRTLTLAGGAPQVVLPAMSVVAADWQPCTPGVTASCESVAPPRCGATTATTQSDQPVDLTGPSCSDPAGRPLTFVVIKAPEHGTLAGRRYTPAPGFTGQDVVIYRVSNGAADSEPVRLTIFVVPRPPSAPVVQPSVRRPPFLSARAKPKLDRRRRTLVRLSCDQDCSLTLRLTARLRSKRALVGAEVTRSVAANRVLVLRLRLPARPASRPKTVWITGIVRNTSGDARDVKLPVTLPS